MQPLFRLNKFFYKYRGRLLAGIAFVAISNLFGIIPAKLIRYALDEAAARIQWYKLTRDFSSANEFITTISFNLLVFVGLVLAMALLKGVFMFFMRQTIIVISRRIEYDMKNEIFDHYQKLDQSFYSVNNTGDLMNRISEDVGRVRMYVGPALMYSVNMIVMFILVIWAMIHVNPALTFFTLLPLPVLAVIIYYVQEIINRKSERVQEKLSGLSTFVQEAFSGIRTLKAHARESYSHREFGKMADDYTNLSMDLVRVNAFFHPAMVIMVGLSTILTIFIGGLKVMEGAITIGNIAEFVIYINMLTWPVAALGWVVSLVQRASASQQRINEFLDTPPTIVSGTHKSHSLEGLIEFRNVSFMYPNSGIKVLSNVSFAVEPGKSLAITGRTGSGKSTIANLLLRFMDPSSGAVMADGKDLRQLNLASFRSQTGFVPQEVFLFSDTIANNIAFGLPPGIPEKERKEKIEKAASDAVIYENIIQFPNGFDTLVGERGITLSGGQKQRISIARAVISEPKLLVFDDCLSAVDTITEEAILANLKKIMKGKTTVIISHRVSSVKHADHIIVLDEGVIAESGTHQELLAMRNQYFELYEKQLLENEPV